MHRVSADTMFDVTDYALPTQSGYGQLANGTSTCGSRGPCSNSGNRAS
jgi:hypothetical protein